MFRAVLSSIALLILAQTPLYAAIEGKVVKYKAGDTNLVGYIAYDTATKGKRPGVIVVPDWWGHGDFARDRAKALAKLGYTAMVMDMYGEGKYVDTPGEAKKLMDAFTAAPKVMKARFMATMDTLSKHTSVDGNHIAAIGYSLGGLVVLEMARQGVSLDGVASIWGFIAKKLGDPAKKGNVKAKILVQHPGADLWAPKEAIKALKEELTDAGADYKILVYRYAKHGFTRPDANKRAAKHKLPLRYDAEAAEVSWNDLSAFLKAAFK